jgi:hypothetical protein
MNLGMAGLSALTTCVLLFVVCDERDEIQRLFSHFSLFSHLKNKFERAITFVTFPWENLIGDQHQWPLGKDGTGCQLLRVASSQFQPKDSHSLVGFLCCETEVFKIAGDGLLGLG